MLKRILTAIVAIALLLPVLYFSDTVIFPVVIALCTLIGVFEMLRCTGLLRHFLLSIPSFLLSACFPLLSWYYMTSGKDNFQEIAVLTVTGMAFYLFAVLTFSHGKLHLNEISITFLTVFYIIAAFTALVTLRYRTTDGKYLYLICFIGAWVTDTFAYFCGRFFGKHKLIPEVSPKKTIEGSIGGILFCVAAMALYGWVVQKHSGGTVVPNYLVLCLSGVAISLVSQVGDLLMSVVKRTYGIKDYGKLFPGHGGILDRFDSVMAVAIVLSIICMLGDPFLIV